MKITADLIKKVRERNGSWGYASEANFRTVWRPACADKRKKQFKFLKRRIRKSCKRESRQTGQGKVFSYSHHNNKIVSVVELFSETDFVSRNELFEQLGKDIALQVASMGEENIENQDFIKDPNKKITDLIKEVIAKTGENIKLGRVVRVELGM